MQIAIIAFVAFVITAFSGHKYMGIALGAVLQRSTHTHFTKLQFHIHPPIDFSAPDDRGGLFTY